MVALTQTLADRGRAVREAVLDAGFGLTVLVR